MPLRANHRTIHRHIGLSMDIIFIRDLRIEARIGIWEWEQRIRQLVSVDIEMGADIRRAAASDAIGDTINYKAVAKRVMAFVEEHHFDLVETLAERLAALLQEEFSIPWLRLSISKPGAVRGSRAVGVTIERGSGQGHDRQRTDNRVES